VARITELRQEMLAAARALDYEKAARLRDRVLTLEEVDLELSG
jgi:excinuclease UvrABC helicase subunit UvrB